MQPWQGRQGSGWRQGVPTTCRAWHADRAVHNTPRVCCVTAGIAHRRVPRFVRKARVIFSPTSCRSVATLFRAMGLRQAPGIP